MASLCSSVVEYPADVRMVMGSNPVEDSWHTEFASFLFILSSLLPSNICGILEVLVNLFVVWSDVEVPKESFQTWRCIQMCGAQLGRRKKFAGSFTHW